MPTLDDLIRANKLLLGDLCTIEETCFRRKFTGSVIGILVNSLNHREFVVVFLTIDGVSKIYGHREVSAHLSCNV